MKLGVNYTIQHSGQFLYKLSNEKDGKNYEITKIQLSEKLKMLEEKTTLLEDEL
jgi:protease II